MDGSELESAEVQRLDFLEARRPASRSRHGLAGYIHLLQGLVNGTADSDVQGAHLPVADEPGPAAGVIRVERPVAMECLQRVTDRLCHDPGPEPLITVPVGAVDEAWLVGDCHD